MLPEKAFLERMKRQLGDEYESYLDSLNRSRAVALPSSIPERRSHNCPSWDSRCPWGPMGYYYDLTPDPACTFFAGRSVYYLQEIAPWRR